VQLQAELARVGCPFRWRYPFGHPSTFFGEGLALYDNLGIMEHARSIFEFAPHLLRVR
jgi:hypothetical protein